MDSFMFNILSPKMSLRLARRELRRVYSVIQNGSLSGSPVFFANSFPKSGTHLLTQVLNGFTRLGPTVDSGLPAVVTFNGPTGMQRPGIDVLRDLNRLKPGDIAYGHLHAVQEVIAVLTGDRFAAYFIYRDPRDVVVSHVHYVTYMAPDHVHHRYYAQTLATFDQRLKTSILGLPDISISYPNIYKRFKPYLGWLEASQVLTLRFEDFILQRGTTLEKVLDHAVNRGFQLTSPRAQALDILDSVIIPEKSPTYRSGTIGKWRESFTQEHKTIFKQIAGDLLIRLGYENDHDW